MHKSARVSLLVCATALGAVSAFPEQLPYEDVVRNLRNPDAKARMDALRLLRDAGYIEATAPIAPLVNDPVDEIQLEAIATEQSFYLVQDVPTKKRLGFVVEVRSKGVAQQVFEQGPLVSWPRPVPPELVDSLLKAVDDENPRVRIDAIYALGIIARPPLAADAAGRLVKALDHYDPSIRAAAARVAGRLELKIATDVLIKAMNDSSPQVRYASMRALGDLREERAVQALTDQFNYYKKGEGAWSALDALARIAHPSSVPLFKANLTNKDEYFRRASAEGLARTGDASELATLQSAANTEQSKMARAAMTFAMQRLGQNYLPRLVDFMSTDNLAPQVQGYLMELGPSIAPSLVPLLQEPDATVRVRITEVLGAIGSHSTIAALEPLAKDHDRTTAAAAGNAIERIKLNSRS
jgi:HEAT repeat protein